MNLRLEKEQKRSKTVLVFFKKVNYIDKSLAGLRGKKKKKENTIRNESGVFALAAHILKLE